MAGVVRASHHVGVVDAVAVWFAGQKEPAVVDTQTWSEVLRVSVLSGIYLEVCEDSDREERAGCGYERGVHSCDCFFNGKVGISDHDFSWLEFVEAWLEDVEFGLGAC